MTTRRSSKLDPLEAPVETTQPQQICFDPSIKIQDLPNVQTLCSRSNSIQPSQPLATPGELVRLTPGFLFETRGVYAMF